MVEEKCLAIELNASDCLCLGVVNSISQACGKFSFQIGNYLRTQKEGMK